MKSTVNKPTYEELLQKTKDQELVINRLQHSELSKSNLEFYFKESLDLVCKVGTDGFLKEINPSFTKILGHSKEELLTNPIIKFLHPDDIESSNIELETISKGIPTINFENRLLKKNGEIVNIQWTSYLDVSQDIIFAIGRDITAIKKAQYELLESNNQLENAQKISKIGSWEYNFKSHKMRWSDELYSIYKLKKKDNQDLFQEYVNRFSDSDVNIFLNKIKESKINKKQFEVEQCATLINNSTIWVQAIVFPVIDNNGDVIGIRGTTQDITEKKQLREILKLKKQADVSEKIKKVEEESNAKFRAYIENSPDGVFVIDENGNYVDVNKTATVMTGFSKEELLTKSFYDLIVSESPQDLDMYFKTLKEQGYINAEYKTRLKSGEIRWRAIRTVKLSESRYIGFSRDITELKQANELIFNTFERITDAFVALDSNWCYTYMNKKAGEIFGCNPQEIIGKHIWTEFPEGIDKPFYKAYYEAVEQQKYIYLEEYYEPYDLWIENHIYPSFDGLSVFFRDITIEKNAKISIENNEKRFRALVENNNEIITIIDKDLNRVFRNMSAIRITGYTHDERQEVSNLDYIHPDFIDYIHQKYAESIENPNIPIPVLFKIKHKEGHTIWLEGVLNNKLDDCSIKGIIGNFRDVTLALESNLLLKKERDIFAKIAETSPGLIYSMRQNLDDTLSYDYASDAIKEIYGFNFEEINYDTAKIFNLIHPDDIEIIIEKIVNTKTNLAPLKGEYRYLHPKKGLVWHEVNSLPTVEPDGSIICHGIITDITERIEANKKIQKANRLYLFISQINKMIARATVQETLFKEACNIAINIGGFKMAWIGLLDSNSTKIMPTTIAGSCQEYLKLIKTITSDENTPEGNGPVGTSIRSGTYCISNDIENDLIMNPWKNEALNCDFKSLMALPIKKSGEVIGAFTLYSGEKNFFDLEEIELLEEATRDITYALDFLEKEKEIFESEKRYHTLTEVSPVGIFRTDADGYTTFVNSSWCEISGITAKEAIGKGWLNAVYEKDKFRLLNNWKNATNKGKKSMSEFRFVHTDGSFSWVMGQAIPEKNENNEIIGYIGTITDITVSKELEAKLIITKEAAETANKSKTNFLANMSHEIRTPLNGIIGFTNLLMKTNLDNNQLDYMSTINVSATLLLDIVNDVLDFSKIESGKLELYIEKFDLYKLINQIVELFKYQAITKKIELILDIDENVPQFIKADSMKIKQILVNLLSNSLKFTEFGEVRLEVKDLNISNDAVSRLEFSVKDTGKGIKLINNKKIFSSFEQEDNSTNRKFGGTGLGLAISNQLLAIMDSKLELNSVYGEGSNFYFSIDVKKATNQISKKQKLTSIYNENEVKITESSELIKILIAEDNKINMLLIKTLVKKIVPNSIILTAFDGGEAIDQFLKEQPDLILMDIQMPIKNGYEAASEIRKLNSTNRIPIIAVTAGILSGEKEKCFEAGMDDYLPKPIVFSDIESIILKWINK